MSVQPLLSRTDPSSSATVSRVRVVVVPTDIILPPFFLVSLIESAVFFVME